MTTADHGKDRRVASGQRQWNSNQVYLTWGLLLTVSLAVWILVVYLALGIIL
jgi:hypothetical protein